MTQKGVQVYGSSPYRMAALGSHGFTKYGLGALLSLTGGVKFSNFVTAQPQRHEDTPWD